MNGSKRVRRLKTTARAEERKAATIATAAVAYLRVSTEGQFSDGYGLDVQETSVRAFAASQGYELVDVIMDRVSGATPPIERKGFRRLVDLAERNAFSILLLYKFDRLARNVMHAVNSVHQLRDRYGVVIRSVTEPIDTATPMGEMIFTVLASMAEQERHTITERTWGGRQEKARKGGFAGGMAPLGYRRDKDGGLVPDEAEGEIVKRIFDLRKAGVKLQAIADQLNADSVPTKRGGIWRPSQVAYILDNPKYRGLVEYLFRWNGADVHVLRDGTHTPIIR